MKAILTVDLEEITILLSGVMLLENQLNEFLKLDEKGRRNLGIEIPSVDDIKASLVRTIDQKRILEIIFGQLDAEFKEAKKKRKGNLRKT